MNLQPVRFQLNHASAKQSGGMYSEREYSIWVSDLPDDITDEDFRKTFSTRYESVVSAKRKFTNFVKQILKELRPDGLHILNLFVIAIVLHFSCSRKSWSRRIGKSLW